MTPSVLLAVSFVVQAATAGSAAPPAAELKVVVSAPVYQPDGGVVTESTPLSATTPSAVHVYGRRTLCDTATTGAAEPADAGFGWRLTSHVVRASEASLVVSVDWQRLWDRGQRIASGPAGTVQLTLRPGDRIPLDLIPNSAPTDACRAVGMALEMSVVRSAAPAVTGALLPLGAVEGGAGALDAELWLVHTLPAGQMRAEPVTVETARGEALVEFTGSFKRYRAATGSEFLLVNMARSIAGVAAPAGGLKGGTETVIPLPGPTEVLAIEIPAAERSVVGRVGGGGRGGPAGGAGGGGFVTSPRGGGVLMPAGQAGTAGAGTRGGGGGGRGASQALAILEGHAFALRLRVTPVSGS
jgi:hypothetical protein